MTKAKRQIEEKERQLSSLSANDTSVRELLGDVIAHQADLRFISMAANKFYEESKVSCIALVSSILIFVLQIVLTCFGSHIFL